MRNKKIQTNIEPAIKHFGSGAAIARAIDVDPMTVTQWKKRGIPAGRVLELVALSKGALKQSDLLTVFIGE